MSEPSERDEMRWLRFQQTCENVQGYRNRAELAKVFYEHLNEHAAEAVRAEREKAEMCDGCAGTGEALSGPCGCGGTGKAYDMLRHVRLALHAAERERDELREKTRSLPRELVVYLRHVT